MLDRIRRRNRRRRRSGETNSLQSRAPMDTRPQDSKSPLTPRQEKLVARLDRGFGVLVSVLGVAWFVVRGVGSLEWLAPYLLIGFWITLMLGGAFALWANRRKIQRAIEDSDFF